MIHQLHRPAVKDNLSYGGCSRVDGQPGKSLAGIYVSGLTDKERSFAGIRDHKTYPSQVRKLANLFGQANKSDEVFIGVPEPALSAGDLADTGISGLDLGVVMHCALNDLLTYELGLCITKLESAFVIVHRPFRDKPFPVDGRKIPDG